MYSIRKILSELEVPHEQIGENRDLFTLILPTDQADSNALIFFDRPDAKTLDRLAEKKYAVALVERTWAAAHRDEIKRRGGAILAVENPRLVIARITSLLFPDDEQTAPGVDPTARVDSNARIHPSVKIGPYCIVGECEIGEGSVIGAFSVIKNGCVLRKRVTVREHCCVGGTGFGFVRNHLGTLERIPHVGHVLLEDDVELFPYVNVDRATFGVTVVGRGTKIDHYAHIGHNSSIGVDTVITAGVVLCGGSRVGDRCWLGVGSIMKEKRTLGNEAKTGLGAVVLRDVPDSTVVVGVPAKPIRE